MACRNPSCGCGFVSETLNISEVSPGVWSFEQAEFSDITQLQDDVAQLQSDLAALQSTVSDGFDAQTAALTAGLASRVARRHTGTPTALSGGVGLGITNTLTLPSDPEYRVLVCLSNTVISKTVAGDVIDVSLRLNGALMIRERLQTVTGGTASMAVVTAVSGGTNPVVSVGVQRALGTGTYSTAAGSADNTLQVLDFRGGVIIS